MLCEINNIIISKNIVIKIIIKAYISDTNSYLLNFNIITQQNF